MFTNLKLNSNYCKYYVILKGCYKIFLIMIFERMLIVWLWFLSFFEKDERLRCYEEKLYKGTNH